MPTLDQSAPMRRAFQLGSALIVAHQVAGKAVRDGLFLSRFSAGDLPKAVACAALISVLLGLGFSRVLSRYGPLRVVPAAFAAGSLLHVVEFLLLQTPGEGMRGVVVTIVYVHLVGFGAILLSGFWSVANEMFDPREARREFGRIAGAGTAGGIFGGLLAERGAALLGGESLLLLLAALHLAAWLTLSRTVGGTVQAAEPGVEEDAWDTAREAFRRAPFLANLAFLVLLGTVTANLLDFLFKSGAAAACGGGPQLTRYFAIFYTASQALTFAVQALLTPVALRRLGLGRTMQGHSTLVGLGAGAALVLPAALAVPAARALELIMRGSFLRSSYELFFTPVPPREKRATKLAIDVSCDRMGDAVGAGVLQLLLVFAPRHAATLILLTTAGLAAIAFLVTRRMDAAYSKVLEHGLMSRAVALREGDAQDSTTLAALMHTRSFAGQAQPPQPVPLRPPVRLHDTLVDRVADLRSGVPRRIQAALAPDQPFDPAIVPLAIRLLAWEPAFEWARAFLLRHAHRSVGQLVDTLLDADEDVTVRRKVPHILAYTSSQRAVEGLTGALSDPRFEIRFNVSRALEFLHRMSEDLRFDQGALSAAVERELLSSRSLWRGRKPPDNRGANDGPYWFWDELLRDRADQSLEHVFRLLAIRLPAEPLKIAFRALHSQDRHLRGLGLEFLESHLPSEMVAALRHLTEPAADAPAASRDARELSELLGSNHSLLAMLENASAGARAPNAM